MQCFSFTEQAVPFLRGVLDEDRDPVIPAPEGCDMSIVLGKEFTRQLTWGATTYPEMRDFKLGYIPHNRISGLSERERRVGVGVEMQLNTLVLKPAERHRSRRNKEQALVRVETAGGAGGKVKLTSNVFDEDLRGGRVIDTYRSFPSMGIQPLCTPEMLKRVNAGVEVLDLFILMNPGARFRIQRSGDLKDSAACGTDAKRFISVTWTGEELRPMNPFYEDRGAAGTFAAA